MDIATNTVVARKQFRGRTRKFARLFFRWGAEFGDEICTTLDAPGSTTTTTTLPGCQSDSDCDPCQCCRLATGTCTGTTGAAYCCNLPPPDPPTTIFPSDVCGPKTPSVCPAASMCPPPAEQGGNYDYCDYCPDSANIIEWYAPSGPGGPRTCTRR